MSNSLPRRMACLLLSIGVVSLATELRAQPANNNCANAILITDGNYAGTTVNATNEGGTGVSCGSASTSPDVWYRYVAPLDGIMTADTCPAASYDTVVSIWTGCPTSGGTQMACDDDACGQLRSTTAASVSNGTQYWIRVTGFSNAVGTFTLHVQTQEGGTGNGPDVIYSDVTDIASYGPIGGIAAYSLSSHTCNIGDQNLAWGGNNPLLAMNAYRLHQGRIEQIGQSFVKNGTGAAAGSGCGLPCNGQGGSVLGSGCLDVYSSGFNGIQSILGPRSMVNGFTGLYPGASGGTGNDIYKRLQVQTTDLQQTPQGALYFVEGVYVAWDDAAAGNAHNNASYKRVTVSGNALTPTGAMQVTHPAIEAWRDHGFGVNTPDLGVILGTVDVPDEGRFHVAHKVANLGGGTWRYTYAIFNLNSDRSGGSLTVPVPQGVNVTNVGFRDVAYHSGEPYSNTDWTTLIDCNGVTWASPQTFAQNPNSNALRWGTMYTYWFDANTASTNGTVTLALFKPHTPQSVTFAAAVPSPATVCALMSDINVDTLINGRDIKPFVSCMLGECIAGNNCECADGDNDGDTDGNDLLLFVGTLIAP